MTEYMRKMDFYPIDNGLEKEINILLGFGYLWEIQVGAVEKK